MPEAVEVDRSRPRVLYLVYWGAAEPLGQSLVLPAVVRLSQLGAALTLVTFEKPTDIERGDEMDRIRGVLRQAGVAWTPLRYHKRPKWPATLWDAVTAVRLALSLRRQGPIDILHVRTFVAGVMGLLVAPLIGARLVFHNEGFYPDEQVDGGFWKAGSWPHRLAKRLEGRLYDRADGLIVLSQRARHAVEQRPLVRARNTAVIVVPSCVDLERFAAAALEQLPWRPGSGVNLVYLGSTGGRYRFDQVAAFTVAVRRVAGRVHLRVLTPTPATSVAAALRLAGLSEAEFSIAQVPHSRVPLELASRHAGLFLFTRGLSEHACSPTKIGEYWAAGLPIVVTPNVSDSEQVVRAESVGVILDDFSEEAQLRAARALVDLLAQPGLAERCRLAAERHYSLEQSALVQYNLYKRLRSPESASPRGVAGVRTGVTG